MHELIFDSNLCGRLGIWFFSFDIWLWCSRLLTLCYDGCWAVTKWYIYLRVLSYCLSFITFHTWRSWVLGTCHASIYFLSKAYIVLILHRRGIFFFFIDWSILILCSGWIALSSLIVLILHRGGISLFSWVFKWKCGWHMKLSQLLICCRYKRLEVLAAFTNAVRTHTLSCMNMYTIDPLGLSPVSTGITVFGL